MYDYNFNIEIEANHETVCSLQQFLLERMRAAAKNLSEELAPNLYYSDYCVESHIWELEQWSNLYDQVGKNIEKIDDENEAKRQLK